MGKWTHKHFIYLPPPPEYNLSNAKTTESYYHIIKKQIKFLFYLEDSVNYFLISRDKSIDFNNPIQDFNGCQKKWRILNVSDSIITIERKYNTAHPYLRPYNDIIDTISPEKNIS